MIEWLKRLLFCKHDFVFVETIIEQNLRAGYEHRSRIYMCRNCQRREVREEATL